MSFRKPTKTKKREPRPPDTGKAVPAKKKIHRSPPIAFKAKILAIAAVNSGADQHYAVGEHFVDWQGRDSAGRAVPSGQYFFRVEAGGEVQIKKALLLK